MTDAELPLPLLQKTLFSLLYKVPYLAFYTNPPSVPIQPREKSLDSSPSFHALAKYSPRVFAP